MKQIKRYCKNCGDNYIEDEFGSETCCDGALLLTRPETDIERARRKRAEQRALQRAKQLDW